MAIELLATDQRFCRTCRYWGGSSRDAYHSWVLGACKRHAPLLEAVVQLHKQHKPEGAWPHTENSDWCGDWEQFNG